MINIKAPLLFSLIEILNSVCFTYHSVAGDVLSDSLRGHVGIVREADSLLWHLAPWYHGDLWCSQVDKELPEDYKGWNV